jgi:RNA polymerase sigma factor (sigma-70 family)
MEGSVMEGLTLPTFEAGYRAWFGAIERHIWRIVADPDLAADLAQETFTRAWGALCAGTVVVSRAWIFRIATNCAIDTLRRRKIIAWTPFSALPVAPDGDVPVEFPASDASTRFADALADREALRRVLAHLKPGEWTCLLLALDASSATCARRLGVSVPTFKMRLSRARRHFQALWHQEEAS